MEDILIPPADGIETFHPSVQLRTYPNLFRQVYKKMGELGLKAGLYPGSAI